MSARPPAWLSEVRRVLRTVVVGAREIVALAIGALVAGVLWLVIVQGVLPGPETAQFSRPLGELVRGELTSEARDDSVLGVVGDPVGPTGFWLTLVVWAGLLAVQRVVIGPFVGRFQLFLRALPLAVLTFLLWGLLFTTLADDRVGLGAGAFGVSDGTATPITYAIASYLCAVGGTRVIELVRTAAWWLPREEQVTQIGTPEQVRELEQEGLLAPGALPTRGRPTSDDE